MGETKVKPEKKVDRGKERSPRDSRRAKKGIKARAIKKLGSIFTSDWFSSVCLVPAVLILAIVLLIFSLKRKKGGLKWPKC